MEDLCGWWWPQYSGCGTRCTGQPVWRNVAAVWSVPALPATTARLLVKVPLRPGEGLGGRGQLYIFIYGFFFNKGLGNYMYIYLRIKLLYYIMFTKDFSRKFFKEIQKILNKPRKV